MISLMKKLDKLMRDREGRWSQSNDAFSPKQPTPASGAPSAPAESRPAIFPAEWGDSPRFPGS